MQETRARSRADTASDGTGTDPDHRAGRRHRERDRARPGHSVGADNRVAAPATTFAPRDTIYASVTTRTSDAAATVPGRLSARWTFQDGQTVHEDSRDLNLTGDGVTAFQISKPDGFPPGRYKVEISLDGSVVQSKEFEVR